MSRRFRPPRGGNRNKTNRPLSRRSAIQFGIATTAAGLASRGQAEPVITGLGQVLSRRRSGPSLHKDLAIRDHRANMARFGGCLSSPASGLLVPLSRQVPYQFDVLVIGSGYGASISAARIASRLRPGMRIGMLERGREWTPGTFPDCPPQVLDESRLQLLGKKKGTLHNPCGLFNVQQFDEISVVSGSGLGGSSLINANVAIRADAEVFCQSVWPSALRDRAYLEPYYELAEFELGVAREPWDHTRKMVAQRKAWEQLVACGASFEAANLTLTRGNPNGLPVVNRQGMLQRPCIDCGDCLTGCNVGAKNTLMFNYLPMARQAGAELYTQVEVHRIENCDGYYRVYFTYHARHGEKYSACHGSTTSRVLVLGAGSLGSSEILLRSQRSNLQFSHRLGHGWTGNGDALGFVRNCPCPTGVSGYGAYPTHRCRVGPTIETNMTYPDRNLSSRVLIQEGSMARAYSNAIGALMGDMDLSQVQILLGMGHDGAAGVISLDEHGYARIRWPGLLESAYRKMIRKEFEQVAASLGGEYKILKIFGDKMVSVHPLGGCAMSDDPAWGVTNHKGQVYDARHGGDMDPRTNQPRVHDGLYVVDGAILPTSIGCNPLLTISALAERCVDHLVAEPALADLFRQI